MKEFIEERFIVFGNMILNANTSSFEIIEDSPVGFNYGPIIIQIAVLILFLCLIICIFK